MRANTHVAAPARVTPMALPLSSAIVAPSGGPTRTKSLPSPCVAVMRNGMPASRNTTVSVAPVRPTSTSPGHDRLHQGGAAAERDEVRVQSLLAEDRFVA